MPRATNAEAGKLATPDTEDQVLGGELTKVQHVIEISPVIGGYWLHGTVNDVDVTLLLDTGAAVSLLHLDVWSQITPPGGLRPWSGASLVSAGGTPLTVHGCTTLPLDVGDNKFCTEFVVVSPLTSEAILGIDFLQAQRAQIDIGHRVLRLRESGCDIHLSSPTTAGPTATQQLLHARDTVEVPPRCVMDIAAVCATVEGGVWLVEEAQNKYPELAVA